MYNLAQMLPVPACLGVKPGSKVKYFREKLLQFVRVLAVLRVYLHIADTASTRSISRLCTANIYTQVLGVR